MSTFKLLIELNSRAITQVFQYLFNCLGRTLGNRCVEKNPVLLLTALVFIISPELLGKSFNFSTPSSGKDSSSSTVLRFTQGRAY